MTKAKTLLDVRKNYYLRTFLWALGLGTLIFLPWIVFNDGYFFFYGDYNVQQIPFYQMIHDSIQSGNIGWSYTTDLGANIIGSYSFYMIGSPFFWITLLFPSSVVPYLLAPLLIIKMALAALGAYVFLRRYVKNQNYAVFGALLYAFSGFSIYNIFFNHFHEALITFPFLLAAVDAFIYDKRKGLVAFAIFASCFINYYFFAGQAVFVFIYWFFRMRTGSFRMSGKSFLRFAVEVILGFLATGVILLPSILAVIQNSRLNSFPTGWGAVVYTSEQRYIHIFESFFFPPDMPAYANFTPDSNAKWASVAAWLPMFSMVGVFSFYKLKTHKWLRVLIPVLFVMAFVPIFNSLFQLLNAAYYARWFYMLTLMLVLATVLCLDNEKTDYRPALKLTFIITVLTAVMIGFMPNNTTDSSGATKTTYGIEKYPDRFWVWVAIAVVALIALTICLALRKKEKAFFTATSILLSVTIAGYGNVLVGVGVSNASYKKDYIETYCLGNRDEFDDLTDIRNVRSDFYDEIDNMGMFWQVPTIQAFQSIVPGSVMDFYKSVGVERSVGSRPKTDVYGIRSFLSVKYLFDNSKHGKTFATNSNTNMMPGYKLLNTEHSYYVYENEYYIPYGFTYDTYITQKEYNDCEESKRHLLLLKSMVLSDEQIEKYGNILKHDDKLSDYNYTQTEYFKDCEERKKLTCSSIDFQNSKFTAKIKTGDSAELVFFSIPYEDGWKAQVNGQPAEIEKVNVGFMAVKVPANTNATIVFKYTTPGLAIGAIVSGSAIILFVVYMLLWKVKPRRRREDGSLYLIDDLSDEETEQTENTNQYIELTDEELLEESEAEEEDPEAPSENEDTDGGEAVTADPEGEGEIEAMAGESTETADDSKPLPDPESKPVSADEKNTEKRKLVSLDEVKKQMNKRSKL